MRYYLVVDEDKSTGVTCNSVENVRLQVESWADEYCSEFYGIDSLFADITVMEIPDKGDVIHMPIKDILDYKHRSPYVIVKRI